MSRKTDHRVCTIISQRQPSPARGRGGPLGKGRDLAPEVSSRYLGTVGRSSRIQERGAQPQRRNRLEPFSAPGRKRFLDECAELGTYVGYVGESLEKSPVLFPNGARSLSFAA